MRQKKELTYLKTTLNYEGCIKSVRMYTSSAEQTSRLCEVGGRALNTNLSFIIGFIDAEGSFSVYMRKDPRYSQGWQIKPVFAIGLHLNDVLLLEDICTFLGVGRIYKTKDSVHLRVESLEGVNKLIKILDNNPFISQKKSGFLSI